MLTVAIGGGLLWATSRPRKKPVEPHPIAPITESHPDPDPVAESQAEPVDADNVPLSVRAYRRARIGVVVVIAASFLGALQHKAILSTFGQLHCNPAGCADMSLVAIGWLLAIVLTAPALLTWQGLLDREMTFPMAMLGLGAHTVIHAAFLAAFESGVTYPNFYPLTLAYAVTTYLALPTAVGVAAYGIQPTDSPRETAYLRLLAGATFHVVLLVITLVLMS